MTEKKNKKKKRSFEDMSASAHKAVATRRKLHPEWGSKKREAEVKKKGK